MRTYLISTLLLFPMLNAWAADAPKKAPIPVEAATVKRMAMPQQINVLGSLAAQNIATVSSEVDGRVAKINFQDGQHVDKGDVIIQLDDTTAKAALTSAQAAYNLSRTTYQRYLALRKFGGVSAQSLDQYKADMESNAAAVKSANSALAQTSLRAPFAGALTAFKVHTGDHISEGATLVQIIDKKQLKALYKVPEVFLPKMRISQPVSVTVDAYKDKQFSGSVSYIAPNIDEVTRSVDTQAIIDNKDEVLSPGMFVRISQKFATDKNALVIPEQAVTASLKGYQVFKITNNHAEPVEVTLGTRVNGFVQISKGLKVGDKVVSAGQQKLGQGADVTIISKEQETAAP